MMFNLLMQRWKQQRAVMGAIAVSSNTAVQWLLNSAGVLHSIIV